jgi:hypothetical protein
MDVRLDPLCSRRDNLSNKYLYAQNGVRMCSWRPLQVGTILQSESDFPKCVGFYLFLSLGEKGHGGPMEKHEEDLDLVPNQHIWSSMPSIGIQYFH